jgi:hypothetical protein
MTNVIPYQSFQIARDEREARKLKEMIRKIWEVAAESSGIEIMACPTCGSIDGRHIDGLCWQEITLPPEPAA